MKIQYNLYFSEEKLAELKARAASQDIPLSTYIKSKLFLEENPALKNKFSQKPIEA